MVFFGVYQVSADIIRSGGNDIFKGPVQKCLVQKSLVWAWYYLAT